MGTSTCYVAENEAEIMFGESDPYLFKKKVSLYLLYL